MVAAVIQRVSYGHLSVYSSDTGLFDSVRINLRQTQPIEDT